MEKIIGSIRPGHIRKLVTCTRCDAQFSSQIWVHKNTQGQIIKFIPRDTECKLCRAQTTETDNHISIQTAIKANSGQLNDLDLRKTKKHAKVCDPCNAILIEVAMRIQSGQIKIDPEA